MRALPSPRIAGSGVKSGMTLRNTLQFPHQHRTGPKGEAANQKIADG